MKRDTRILATLGPSSASEKVLYNMAANGMNASRLNFSHGSHSDHQKLLNLIRKVNQKYKTDIKILQDLEGYRIRVGHFKEPKNLQKGMIVSMSEHNSNELNHIPFDYDENINKIKKGYDVFIDDGTIHLRVVGRKDGKLSLEVVQGGMLKERKGINIPNLKLKADILTNKDKQDIKFGIKNKVDFIAQSFVRNKNDILNICKLVRKKLPDCKIIAKIENEEGVLNIDEILDACDGIIVARGDLGVTLPVYKIPIVQKYLILRAIRKKKIAVTATQMLESMTEHNRPTRAEVSDVANAVLDQTDYVMLSGETAVGKYPDSAVGMMRQVIEYTEKFEQIQI
ncbi:MAG: pyruvate kinase [Candidatus Omnitrophica bacterium]|nr:pyruvate kinase [Candidatus Omnitrophota bacterium]MBU1995524.1 pyruvate kinase [Candidatus Omnitrophota bacterium]MBU4334117.1 pyruvate kinase [Candidatus Omnitrophota bacterium]